MKDPLCGLKRTACIGLHAQSSYYAVADLNHLDVVHWDGLTPSEQHQWFEHSRLFLEEIRPVAVTCPPVGAVSPPAVTAGAVTRPVDYFELAKSSARSDAARVLEFRGLDTSDGRD